MYNPSNRNYGDENSRNFENSNLLNLTDHEDDIDKDKIITGTVSKKEKTKEHFPKNFWYIYAE